MSTTAAAPRWQDEVYDLLRQHNVTQIAYVPDAGHKILIERALADPAVHAVALTTEEEGVALLAGADLGGARGVLLMQSSGAGNCINMLSLTAGGRFPFLTLVSMRGDFGEGNPWQYPMGQATQKVLEAMGVIVLRAETGRTRWCPSSVPRSPRPSRPAAPWRCCSRSGCLGRRGSEITRHPGKEAMASHRRAALRSGTSGGKCSTRGWRSRIASPCGLSFRDDRWVVGMTTQAKTMADAIAPAFVLDRCEAVPALIGRHEDFLIVAGLAGTSRDVAAPHR